MWSCSTSIMSCWVLVHSSTRAALASVWLHLCSCICPCSIVWRSPSAGLSPPQKSDLKPPSLSRPKACCLHRQPPQLPSPSYQSVPAVLFPFHPLPFCLPRSLSPSLFLHQISCPSSPPMPPRPCSHRSHNTAI